MTVIMISVIKLKSILLASKIRFIAIVIGRFNNTKLKQKLHLQKLIYNKISQSSNIIAS